MKGLVVAIDGPSGVGKSTVGKAVAARLGVPYLDTGAMYRAVGLAVKRKGIALPLEDPGGGRRGRVPCGRARDGERRGRADVAERRGRVPGDPDAGDFGVRLGCLRRAGRETPPRGHAAQPRARGRRRPRGARHRDEGRPRDAAQVLPHGARRRCGRAAGSRSFRPGALLRPSLRCSRTWKRAITRIPRGPIHRSGTMGRTRESTRPRCRSRRSSTASFRPSAGEFRRPVDRSPPARLTSTVPAA